MKSRNRSDVAAVSKIHFQPLYVNQKRAAERFDVSEWLKQKRYKGDGPPYYKMGRNIRYRLDEIDRWFESYLLASSNNNDLITISGTPSTLREKK